MRIFLDTADVFEIREAWETGLIDGVTTNPSLILKSKRELGAVANQLYSEFSEMESISTEVVADTHEEMLSQAKEYYTIGPNITIKVPCTVEGLKACKFLSNVGVKTNVTLVFSVAQAILAAKAGATYISPFLGRWRDNSVDEITLIENIRSVYDRWNGETPNILAASVRDVMQAEKSAIAGADVMTIPPSVFWKMYNNILTDQGLDRFNKDWQDALAQQEKDAKS